MTSVMDTVATKHQGKGNNNAQTSITTPPPPAETAIEAFSYDGDAHGSFELQTLADASCRLIVVLQANSPQVVESRGAVKPGDFLNTVTGRDVLGDHVRPRGHRQVLAAVHPARG